MRVYQRTEGGVTATMSVREALAEVNTAMMEGSHLVAEMSSQHGRHDITYTDGRHVLLVEVEEEFTQGQAVVVQRPGQAPIAGAVAHIHTAPGYVAVLDDRSRAVSTYPARFVSAAEPEPTKPNLVTHTGTVHAAGHYDKRVRGNVPKCCASVSAIARMHYLCDTTAPVTCKRCLAALAKEGA